MRGLIAFLAIVGFSLGAAVAQDMTDQIDGMYVDEPTYEVKQSEPRPQPPIKAFCELETGFGLLALADDQNMFDEIKAKLEAGEYVGIAVDGLDIVAVVSSGGYQVIGAKVREGFGTSGDLVICYHTY